MIDGPLGGWWGVKGDVKEKGLVRGAAAHKQLYRHTAGQQQRQAGLNKAEERQHTRDAKDNAIMVYSNNHNRGQRHYGIQPQPRKENTATTVTSEMQRLLMRELLGKRLLQDSEE